MKDIMAVLKLVVFVEYICRRCDLRWTQPRFREPDGWKDHGKIGELCPYCNSEHIALNAFKDGFGPRDAA